MAMEQTAVGQTTIARRAFPSLSPQGIARAMYAPVALAGRILLGDGSGPREYPRERLPEHRLYQILSGRSDLIDACSDRSLGKRQNG